ncbi:hypothetical protein AU476_22530 [Cupriavidus sp. UYMSc13B]|nr:hypothetical protein AU476_22530 [Cupriavidus sp. UYMSc13B]
MPLAFVPRISTLKRARELRETTNILQVILKITTFADFCDYFLKLLAFTFFRALFLVFSKMRLVNLD